MSARSLWALHIGAHPRRLPGVNLQIVPLAITMMAGPQIMSSIIFVTHPKPLRVSAAFLAGVTIATAAGVLLAVGIANLLADRIDLGGSSDKGSLGTIIQVALVALLVVAAVKNYLGRETVEPPKWLGKLQNADPKKAFRTGLLLILLMPSDIVIMLTVGMNLEHNNSPWVDALPFIAATVLVAALPLLTYILFRRRAEKMMPRVRDWMNTNSWLVNIIVCGIFIALILV
jgi:threonine/homoserine/homoserine lactone efflux protein